MRTTIKTLSTIVVLASMILLNGCQKENHFTELTSKTTISSINASIHHMQTRVSGNQWDAMDEIGLFLSEVNKSDYLFSNIVYRTVGGDGVFVPSVNENAVSIPNEGQHVDLKAYYPYAASVANGRIPINVTDQSNPAKIDLLYSNNISDITADNKSFSMVFTHQLTKIELVIASNSPEHTLDGLNVKLQNAPTQAVFSIANESITDVSAIGSISFNVSDDGKAASAIVLPTADLSAMSFVFELGEESFSFSLKDALTITSFEKSTLYKYNVTLDAKDKLIRVASINGQITEWIAGKSEDIVAEKDTEEDPTIDPEDPEEDTPVVEGPKGSGTKDDPYNVASLLKKSSGADVWVEGYIVGYAIGPTNNEYSAKGADETNIILADSNSEREKAKTSAIKLGTGSAAQKATRSALNLKDNPHLLGKKVKVRGDVVKYMGTMGLEKADDYVIIN